MQAVLATYQAKTVGPIADWPSGYAAFVFRGVTAIEDHVAQRQRIELESLPGRKSSSSTRKGTSWSPPWL